MKYIKFQNDEGFIFIEEFKTFKSTCVDAKICVSINGQVCCFSTKKIAYGNCQLIEKRVTKFISSDSTFLDLTAEIKDGE